MKNMYILRHRGTINFVGCIVLIHCYKDLSMTRRSCKLLLIILMPRRGHYLGVIIQACNHRGCKIVITRQEMEIIVFKLFHWHLKMHKILKATRYHSICFLFLDQLSRIQFLISPLKKDIFVIQMIIGLQLEK